MEKRHLIDSLMMLSFFPSFKQKALRGSKFELLLNQLQQVISQIITL